MSATDDAMQVLGRLAELGVSLVERLHAAAMAADDTETMCRLTDAFCDVGRGVRQSIALRMRIESGSFAVVHGRSVAADRNPDEERDEGVERPERCDWNEYERPDWETPLRLTGDPVLDEDAIRTAVETAVTRVRRNYAKGLALIEPRPAAPPGRRAALLGGAAPLRVVDSS